MKIKVGDVFIEKKNNLHLKFSNLNESRSKVILLDENTNKKYSLKMETFKTAINSGKLIKKCNGIDQLLESNYQILLRSEKEFKNKMRFFNEFNSSRKKTLLNEVFIIPSNKPLNLIDKNDNSKIYVVTILNAIETSGKLVINGYFDDSGQQTDIKITYDKTKQTYTIKDAPGNDLNIKYALEKTYTDYINGLDKMLVVLAKKKLEEYLKTNNTKNIKVTHNTDITKPAINITNDYEVTPDIDKISLLDNTIKIPAILTTNYVVIELQFDVEQNTSNVADKGGNIISEYTLPINPLKNILNDLMGKDFDSIVQANQPPGNPPPGNPPPSNPEPVFVPIIDDFKVLIDPTNGTLHKVMLSLLDIQRNMGGYNQKAQDYINMLSKYIADTNSEIKKFITSLSSMKTT
jgi:hypothetical protein